MVYREGRGRNTTGGRSARTRSAPAAQFFRTYRACEHADWPRSRARAARRQWRWRERGAHRHNATIPCAARCPEAPVDADMTCGGKTCVQKSRNNAHTSPLNPCRRWRTAVQTVHRARADRNKGLASATTSHDAHCTRRSVRNRMRKPRHEMFPNTSNGAQRYRFCLAVLYGSFFETSV